ncbi:uncharacterized protein LOC129913211 [Episyrphus balteatus]|uniref:uncharacterized protein LOC129913211 n=1 Tax=Episyrphus balteatus TaxID=286459 RepID=UPI002485831C|nr:uncharacterized protein LOC129913211 [Episyrphus balteatus]
MRLIVKMKLKRTRTYFNALLLMLVLCGLHLTDAARQNPLKNPKICGRPICDLITSKFGYTDTNRYKYDYNVHLRTEFLGTGQNTSDVYIQTTVDLIFPKPCEGVMTLSAVQLREKITKEEEPTPKPTEANTFVDYYDYTNLDKSSEDEAAVYDVNLHPNSTDLAVDLQKYNLRFSFHDGVISEVCPNTAEPAWVLNFKKGILSKIQNTMLRFDVDLNATETDVAGQCNVAYELEGTKDAFVIIKKTKDLQSCRFRQSTHSILQTTPYVFREDKAIWPILSSHSYCNLTIDRNIYSEVSCFERHQLIPFSSNQSGAVTVAHAKLLLKTEEKYNSADFFTYEDENLIEKRSPLLFDHTPATKPTHGEIRASRDLLKQMCEVGFPNIQREFIDVFTNFLQTTKHLDYKALTQLLARSAGICSNGKNHVLESLPYIGSTASYQLMRDQIVSNTIPKQLAQSWMTSLAFIQRPDDETLETFYTILDFSKKKIDAEYTLASTAAIHSYCRHNPDCGSNEKIQKIINLLETEFLSLFNMYKHERRTHDRLMVILKGLGNIGVLSEPFAEQLKELITENITPVDIRLQSVLAFRRVDCQKYKEFFLETYGNVTINSEIRIFSYIQAMRCPDHYSIDFIKEVLKREEINQVGSYVWSHLKNLAKSSSPVRVEAQGLLVNDDLADKFKLDMRKFSRNYEHSLFFDEYNFGTATDANLIFGTESYLPRMATLNFTADLFGQSVNFFEISARAEGFEELATSIFGPKGPYNKDFLRKQFSFLTTWLGENTAINEDSIDNLLAFDPLRIKRSTTDFNDNEDYQFEEEDESSSSRKRRSTESTETIQNNIENLGYKLNYNYNNPKATLGLRIFGNDLQFYSIEGLIEVMALAKEFDPFHQAAKILSGNELKYTKSSVFLDASYNIPTEIGLPLSIHAFGASSVDLRLSGSLERLRDSLDYKSFDFNGKIKPSVSVDVITTLQTDAFYALSGIRVKSNLYSSSALEAKMKIRGANLVSFTFSLPQDKNEIFSARSEMIVMKESEEIPQVGIEKRRSNTTCTWPVLDQAIGLKVCSSFSVPDLVVDSANVTNHPSLLLSGPMNISWILEKSDLSAKEFVFEYKWTQVKNDSKWSLIFTTPHSTITRLFMANVSTTPEAANASLRFINGAQTYSAGGVYNGNPADRSLDIWIDTNGRKNLNFNAEIKRSQERNAWIYKPKALLSVNGENITGLLGTIRINEKNGISQNDIELTFETKKLQAWIRGNVVKTEINTSTNMTVRYRFESKKIETVNFEGKLTNTGDKSKTEYNGNVKLRTSAHPKLNFASNATWLSLQGHTEGVVTYNNVPDAINPNQTSQLRLVFARSFSEEFGWEGSRTKASLELFMPKSNIDFRILVKHEERSKNGTEHNVIIGLRYAPQKEATGVFSAHFPRRNLFAVDAYMNLTVPEFNSCTVRLQLNERVKENYMINFNGTWFSGHSISIKGNYKDKSSALQILHQLKLLVESPSFEVTSFNMIFRRSQLVIIADIQAKYNKDPYGLSLQYNRNENQTNSNAEVKLKIKDREYGIAAKLLSQQPKLLQIEIHLDKLRDIHLKVGVLTVAKQKELSVELKWDANRDPSQRLALNAEYNNPANRTYDSTIMFTYPDRTFSCGFNIFAGGPKYYGSARATWGTNDVILFNYDAGFFSGKEFNNWIRAELSTPFQGWYKNSLKAGVFNRDNLYLGNASLLWAENQNLQIGYESNYEVAEPLLSFHVELGVNSTIKDIPTIKMKVKHRQDLKKFDSELDFRHTDVNDTEILKIYSVRSVWEVLKTGGYHNVSGSVLMVSPFNGYRKGGLATKLSLSDDRHVQGVASLNFDIREFTLALDGYVRKFTDSMLEVNITTPLEKFRTINGRFGLSEQKRHAVAEVRSGNLALGAEILFVVNAFSDFDVKLSLATPIENFNQLSFIGKVKPITVDLRGSLNNSTLGFTGVWRFHNATDFEYSYQVYTPFQGFEHNGFVLKFIKTDIFVLEAHGKLSKHKLGVKINGRSKSKLLTLISPNKLDLELFYDEDLRPQSHDDDEEDYDEEEYDLSEYFSYFVEGEVDTLTWPTIKGQVDIQEIYDYYIIVGDANLPAGRVDFKDRLYYPDMMNVKNILNLWTPFESCRNLKNIFEYHVDLDRYFVEKVDFAIDNGGNSKPTEFGFMVNYTKVLEEKLVKQHEMALRVKTPYDILKEIEVEAVLELDDNIRRGNITSRTPSTTLSLAASVEIEENFLETSVGFNLDSDVVPFYGCRAYIKKDFSDVDNSLDLQFEVNDNGTINLVKLETVWHLNQENIINAKGKLHTSMLPLKLAETSILITKGPNPNFNMDFAMVHREGQRIEYGSRASKKKDVINIELWTPMKNFKNVSLHGTFVRNQAKPNEYLVNGHLYRNMAVFIVSGTVKMAETYPTQARLRVQPKAGGPDGFIELDVKNDDDKYGKSFQFSAVEDGKMCQISGGYTFRNKFDWDFDTLIQSSEPEISRISVNGKAQPKGEGYFIGELGFQTPWRQFGLESGSFETGVNVQKDSGKIEGQYTIGELKVGKAFTWSWIFAQNMQLLLESSSSNGVTQPRKAEISIKYVNPNKSFHRLLTGGKVNVDSQWVLDVNGTLAFISRGDIQAGLVLQLPKPVGDIHHLGVRYRGNLMTNEPPNVFAESKYESQEAMNKFVTRVSYRNVDDLQGLCSIKWGKMANMSTIEGDFQVLRKKQVRKEFYAKLTTPMYEEETLFVRGNYDAEKDFHLLMCTLDSPASKRLGEIDMAFNTLSNMKGFVNGTLPFFNITWLRADINFTTSGGETIRYAKATWPEDSGFFNLHSTYTSQNLNRDLQGSIQLEVPLTTRHQANIDYSMKERELLHIGQANVIYNEKNVLNGRYNCKTEQRMGFEKDVIDITLENELKPLGIHYIHSKQYTNAEMPDNDMKHWEIFELRNSKTMNLTGELHVRTTDTGQEFKIVAIHPNRTIIINSEYDYLDMMTKHKSKLQLAPTAWIGYNIELGNSSTASNESQNFLLELSYPRRNLSAEGWYYVTSDRFDSDLSLKWTIDQSEEKKTLRTGLLWQSEKLQQGDKDNQSIVFTIGHPYLEKDVQFKGSFYRGLEDLVKANLIVEYSDDPDHLLTLEALLKDLGTRNSITNYTLDVVVLHPASTLNVNVHGIAMAKSSYYKADTNAFYQRGYFPIKKGRFLAKLDLNNKEFEYERNTPYRQIRLWAVPYTKYPLYGLNATVWDSPDLNNTGFVYVDLAKKYARAEFNLTEDSSQNLQMIGHIPDARSGFLDIWRNYEEIRIIDVSSYYKMNHSRLITGKFHWRPKIKEELKAKFKSIGTSFYTSFSDGIDFWIKNMYTETSESINDVWSTASVHTQSFLDDVGELSVLEQDLEELRVFVNQSYEANDFYIKTFVNFTLSVLDELAIRDHIESLPKIFTELWHAMGDSGKALRKNILWLIETIKTSYQKALEAISRFFHGDSLRYLSDLMEKGVEKYDKFIKDLHISFIKYVENLWNKISTMLANYWKSVLKRIEPHVFRFLSYIETAAWDISKEIFDFIYKRTNELAESPYFNKVSSFTQDVDRLYKDIKSNDAITNIKKYSVIAWNFIKEKYFKLVPFGNELNEIITEIVDKIKGLQKLQHIQLILQKFDEIFAKIEWLADELQLEYRLHQLYALIRNKLQTYTLNALETADMYREAKTYFVFDPEVGVIDLEQKLPMSWHSFNETPKFEEIPEYRMLAKAQNFFASTNASIVRYLYGLKSNLDPETWLPPYTERSLLIGSRHYMTFDKSFVGLNLECDERGQQCSYVLAHDFFQRNFTLLLEPSTSSRIPTKKLTLLTDDKVLEINLEDDTLTIDGNHSPMLPMQFGSVTIYREMDILTIHSKKDFNLNCNIQFNLCWFEVAGWYFGQTAGLLGTLNNEPFDEYMTSRNHVVNDTEEFTDSWSLQSCKQRKISSKIKASDEVLEACEHIFTSGILSACSDTISPLPFLEMCKDLGVNSNSMRDHNPAMKGVCTAALAYIEACANSKILMRVPDQCIFCKLLNGTYVPEGTFITLNKEDIPKTADVVFIVEAKPCNANLTFEKNLMTVVASLEAEFAAAKINNNRFSVLAFGGFEPFNVPRSIIHHNQVFTSDINELQKYFDHIEVGNGNNSDILAAISAATQLEFRPGASKVLILLSCSDCSSKAMKFDFTSILQYMLEEGVNLHILADTEFEFERTRKLRQFFGLDRDFVYSKRFVDGDAATRKQLHIPKDNLGLCAPLALETNGSVFSARKLQPEHRHPTKKIASIFAKRVAKTAAPNNCQQCECTGHDTGVAHLSCAPCSLPTHSAVEDYDFQFNWEWDDDKIDEEI